MNQESKKCQNCNNEFVIEPDDFVFYEKIKVPAPTFCPECRMQRRLLFRNERTLYKRPCGLCGKDVVSLFHKDSPQTVYCQQCWWSDKWNPLDYGKEYDFSRPFFEQFRELMYKVPVPVVTTFYTTLLNSDYNNQVSNLKNCYLLFNSDYNENCGYGTEVEHSKDAFDNLMIDECSIAYSNINCQKCYEIFYSIDCENSHNIWFSKNLVGCSNCFGCVNLRNAQYHIWNKAYTKEEYEKKIKSFGLDSWGNIKEYKSQFKDFAKKFPYKYIHGKLNTNVTGDYITHSKDVKHSFIVTEAQNCKYCWWLLVKPVKDCWDYMEFGDNAQNIYESMNAGDGVSDVKFGLFCFTNVARAQYSTRCYTSHDIFGCVSLRNKSFCILNKQYSEDEYNILMPKIIEHMSAMPYTDKKGNVYKYGEYFPSEISPFGYNETSALEYFPLTKEEALVAGFSWKDAEEKGYQIDIKPRDLPQSTNDVDNDILKKVIACEHEGKCTENCTTAFRIIPQELQFLKRVGIPLPRLCPNCRYAERTKDRNPLKLWHCKCQCAGAASENGIYQNTAKHFHGDGHCPNEFETSYAPDRKEIVYCEQCYQQEVS